MSDDVTPRLGMPMLQPGQAQKELFHNEALALIDIAVAGSVAAVGLTVPPAAPTLGQCWIVGSGATGVWSGHDNQLAGWTQGGWRFVAPTDGMAVWSAQDGVIAHFVEGIWIVGETRCARVTIDSKQIIGARQPAIQPDSGGTIVDVEARATIGAILTAMRGHGLIEN